MEYTFETLIGIAIVAVVVICVAMRLSPYEDMPYGHIEVDSGLPKIWNTFLVVPPGYGQRFAQNTNPPVRTDTNMTPRDVRHLGRSVRKFLAE